MESSQHIPEFLETLNDVSGPSTKRRAAMWAIAHIASSSYGILLLMKSDVVSLLHNIAVSDPCLSLRG